MLGILKAISTAIMVVAIFYVGGVASLETLDRFGDFGWATKTVTFWTGGAVLALVLAEMTRRLISDVAAFLEDEAGQPQLKFEVDEIKEDLPPRPAARPTAPPPKPAAAPVRK